ncbi:MAG: tRNA-dihydrouridine synthase [Candidatus Dojkabacteria bacterium]|nr:tRNA-dihydrouridine synthase [Candidatus Dojkabacteria bacterium]
MKTFLAPMEDITDTVFRQVLCDIGRPDIFFTEFMNVDGFCSEGRDAVIHRLKFVDKERPIIIQLWGNTPENYAETVKYLVENVKPDGIDINMGCSVKDVLKTGGGGALIKQKDLVKEIIEVVRGNIGDIPLSVKTRLGYNSVDYDWIEYLLSFNLAMLTIHGRLVKEGYNVSCRWDDIGKCVDIKNSISPTTLLIGNGDIFSKEQGEEYVGKYNLDGYMVGRGILQNPWIFSDKNNVSKEERISVLKKHVKLYLDTWGGEKHFYTQRKYIKAYINGFDGAVKLRNELMLMGAEDILAF